MWINICKAVKTLEALKQTNIPIPYTKLDFILKRHHLGRGLWGSLEGGYCIMS